MEAVGDITDEDGEAKIPVGGLEAGTGELTDLLFSSLINPLDCLPFDITVSIEGWFLVWPFFPLDFR